MAQLGSSSIYGDLDLKKNNIKQVNKINETTDLELSYLEGVTSGIQGQIDGKASTATSVTAGNGLTGGGTLSATRTVTLGTPSTVTNSTTNSVTATSHTHALTLVKADITALGIPAQDTVYTHPATHPATMITEDTSHKFVTDAQITSWNGKTDLALGTTSTTAYRGDYGNTAYTHAVSAHAPSNAQANQTLTSGNGMAAWTATSGNLTVALGTPSTVTNATTNSVTATSHTHALTLTKADITALGIPAQDTVYTHPASHPPSIITQDASNRFVTDTEKATWNSKASSSHTHLMITATSDVPDYANILY